MKKNILLASLAAIGISIGIISCNKDDVTLNNGNNQLSVKTLFDGLKSPHQNFTVTAGQQTVITGANGTRITFRPTTFKTATGQAISSGNIQIELTEIYKPAQMIANRVFTTTTANAMLTSGGAVNIKATLNGQQVYATGGYDIDFKQDADRNQAMELYTGVPLTDSTGTSIVWSETSSNLAERTTKDSGSNTFYYAFDSCTNFNWINCDYFYNAPGPKTDVVVVAPDSSYNNSNTMVFVIFRSINSVSGLWSYSGAATHSFGFGYPGYHIPVGAVIDIVVLGSKNNAYFMDVHEDITVTNGMSVNLTPVTKTLAEVQAVLNTL